MMKKGFALITVLAVLIVIALGTATILQSVGSQNDLKSNNVRDVQAHYLAEAVMQHILWQCRQPGGGGCPVSPAPIVLGGITFNIDTSARPRIRITADYPDI